MINYYENYLTDKECDHLIDTFNTLFTPDLYNTPPIENALELLDSKGLSENRLYKMYQVNKSLFYTDKDNHNLGTDKFKDFNLQALRLQMVDKTIDQITLFHAHQVLFSFSVFLNTVDEGGELEFETGELFKPKKGDLVYFSCDLPHRVRQVSDKRYTLVGSTFNDPLGIRSNLI